ncbi:MAG TPA: phosphate ABC transporter permease subunit PstC [Candidatus Dormibacteraeota bacterium]|nr:phosphate ABC transporter permease subunit PstC [Candidatus Dormibacteraeota bacterium]
MASPARSRAKLADRVAAGGVLVAAGIAILVVVLVVAFLAVKATPVFTSSAIGAGSFFSGFTWQPDFPVPGSGGGFGGDVGPFAAFGALTPILGSVEVVVLALVIAVPVALSLALVLEETDPVIGQRFLRPAIEIFVGIPSVVYGYLGFTVLRPIFKPLAAQAGGTGEGILLAGIVLAIMVVPTIATLSADGLRSVPRSLKEASMALGATRWQTMYKVQLPAARSTIISGVVLGFARAMGEALAVALVIGNVNQLPQFDKYGLHAFVQPSLTMTTTITQNIQNIAIEPEATAARYMLSIVLLLITFLCILAVRFLNRRAPQVVS